jgi:hypothetical protein
VRRISPRSPTSVYRPSGELHGPVVITMIAVRMMQPAVDEIIYMIAMRHGFVSAVWPMHVSTMGLGVHRTGFVASTASACSST